MPPAVSDPEGLSRKNLLGNTGTKETGQGRRACQGRCGCGQGHLPRPPVLIHPSGVIMVSPHMQLVGTWIEC